ncbi:DDE-type integrase/transposase/recombinase [Bacillus sp. FDAARGOS_235]|uniref:DDE-type integrase/transposase/recombinase n=1 Tax=Bacillus sp. FDAARGOS_235 TaxID=1839798 RepID=UPI00351BA031
MFLVAVGSYCRFPLSYRDVSEISKERGVSVHPTTIMRWIHKYRNLIYQIWKNKSVHSSWHLDETYIKVKEEWCYLYHAIEQAHRHVKRRFTRSSGFQSLHHASRTIKGIETIHALYKQKTKFNELQHLLTIA